MKLISRCEARGSRVGAEKFNLRALIENVMLLRKSAVQSKKLSFNLIWDGDLPEYVIGDATQIQRILLNLIDNAIKFIARGSVTVGLRQVQRKGRRLVIECWVQDTDIGIPADKKEQIIEDFHGKIYVENIEQGTAFIFLVSLKMPLSQDV